MNVSLNWLRELLPSLEEDAGEVADRLSMGVVAVDEVVPAGRGLQAIRVGRVLEAAPHPNADRLTLCRVEAGGEAPVKVVCGAPNVEEGSLYPYVPPGGRLPGGMEIEARTIRGEESQGMLCSARELELGSDADGILRLDDELEPGVPLAEALGLPDARLVLDLTPNRVDLACHVGVARELAPPDGPDPRLRSFDGPSWDPDWDDGARSATAGGVTVTVEEPGRCSRYLGAVIRGVTVGPSPAWLAGRLRAVGARPVNNVVDATNYVLRELNQPLHAFDLEKLRGGEVGVRSAREGETLRTLDGEERELKEEMSVITDAGGPVALAGVMGGEESEVTASTSDVFVECAWFDPRATRRTAERAGLTTDASYRFEREIDPTVQERALRRCVELVLATAGGDAEVEAVRVGGPPPDLSTVPLRPERVRQVLGRSFDAGELDRLLRPLGFEPVDPDPDAGGEGALHFRVPGWRGDVTREIDLVEEVARRHGYEAFPSERRAFRPSAVPDDPTWLRSRRVRRLMRERGLLEARSSSLVSRGEADPEAPVELLHPLASDASYLRGGIVPVLLRRLEHNFARGVRDVRLYELGAIFRREAPAADDLGDDGADEARAEAPPPEPDAEVGDLGYREERRVGAVLTGHRRPEHWEEEPALLDVWDLKGLARETADRLWGGRLEVGAGDDDTAVRRFAASEWLGRKRFFLLREGEPVGVAGRVRPEAVDAPPWAGSVFGMELLLEAVAERSRSVHRELSTYPPVRRDLAVTVPVEVEAAEVEAAVREAAPEFLEEVRLFDVYEGEGVGSDRRSLAYRFRFRAPDRTLRDEEAESALETILAMLEERFDARVRAG